MVSMSKKVGTSFLLVGFVCFLMGFVSALDVSDVSNFNVQRMGYGEGEAWEAGDGNVNSYVRSFGSGDGFTSLLIVEMGFDETLDLLERISYTRYLQNGGSSKGRACYERVYVAIDGRWAQVYHRDWNGISFTNYDTVYVPGSWSGIDGVRIELYASVSGHTSGNDLRLYEVDFHGEVFDEFVISDWKVAEGSFNNESLVVRFNASHLSGNETVRVPVEAFLTDPFGNVFDVPFYVSQVFSLGGFDWGINFGESVADAPGNYSLKIVVDPYDEFAEFNESDNEFVFEFEVLEAPDMIAPQSISDLNVVDSSRSSIKWEWVNPDDVDFFENLVFIDGVNVVNSSDEFYEASGLDAGEEYEITVYTKDFSGNVNWSGVSDVGETERDLRKVYRKRSGGRDDSDDEVVIFSKSDEVRSGTIDVSEVVFLEGSDDSSGISFFVWLLIVGVFLLTVAIGLVFVL